MMLLRIPATVLAMILTALPCFAELPGKQSEWHGFTRNDFSHDGRKCILVSPKMAADGKPWVWRARFFGHEPQADVALLKLGYHITYCDVGGLFGSPAAVKHWNSFYKLATQEFGLAKKPALEGMSRGGLIIYNWAIANPGKVACLYGDAPVCDFKSWPGGKGNGKGGAGAWANCLKAYGFTEKQALEFPGNPVDNLEPLAKAKVPILHVVGAADVVVPVAENSALIEARYKKLGGEIQVISKPGIGHHPHALKDPAPIVKFILEHTSQVEETGKKETTSVGTPDPKTTFYQGRTLDDWVSCLDSEKSYVRYITVTRLNGEGPCLPYFVPRLLSLTSDENSRVSREAIHALAQLGDAASIAEPLLQEIASSADHPNRSAALAALGQIGGASPEKRIKLLRKMVKSKDPIQRGIAARGLWKLEQNPKHLGTVLESTASLKHCPRIGVVLALARFAAQEEAFLPELERFVRANPDRPHHNTEKLILSHIQKKSDPLIAARRARQAKQN